MTGRASEISEADERSEGSFKEYTSPLEVSFSLLNICFSGRGVRGEGRASGCSVAQGVGGFPLFHLVQWKSNE